MDTSALCTHLKLIQEYPITELKPIFLFPWVVVQELDTLCYQADVLEGVHEAMKFLRDCILTNRPGFLFQAYHEVHVYLLTF